MHALYSLSPYASVCITLHIVLDYSERGPRKQIPENFEIREFWRKLELAFQGVSKEATNLSMAFSVTPAPKEMDCSKLCGGLETAILAVVSTFCSLPLNYGTTLQNVLHSHVLDVVHSVQVLASSIEMGKTHQLSQKPDHLQSTGSVWSVCDSVSQLPQDNKAATLAKLKSVSNLVKDALEELEEMKSTKGTTCSLDVFGMLDVDEGDGEADSVEGSSTWSEEDERMVAPSLGLVKATKSVLKKVTSAIEMQCQSPPMLPQASELDDIVATIDPLSERVDELVSTMYVPMDRKAVQQNAAALSDVLQSVLATFRNLSLFRDGDRDWTEFLSSAVNHNLQKIQSAPNTL